MRIVRSLVPEDLGLWLVPLLWIFVVVLILDGLDILDPDYRKLTVLMLLVYLSCVLTTAFRARP
jgi:hypothetical protein